MGDTPSNRQNGQGGQGGRSKSYSKNSKNSKNKSLRQAKANPKPLGPKDYDSLYDHPEFNKRPDHRLTEDDVEVIKTKFANIFEKVLANKIVDKEKFNKSSSIDKLAQIASRRFDRYLIKYYPECMITECRMVKSDEDSMIKRFNIYVEIMMFHRFDDNIRKYKRLTIN